MALGTRHRTVALALGALLLLVAAAVLVPRDDAPTTTVR